MLAEPPGVTGPMPRTATEPLIVYSSQMTSKRSRGIAQRSSSRVLRALVILLFIAALPGTVPAETGGEAWLRYPSLSPNAASLYRNSPSRILLLGDSLVLNTARQELARGLHQMLGRTFEIAPQPENAFVLGTLKDMDTLAPKLRPPEHLQRDAFWLKTIRIRGSQSVIITAANDRGVLYGVFALLSKIARGEGIATLDEVQRPYAPIRWVDQWDNLDGSIERGYGGPSIFFEHGQGRDHLPRAGQYPRLLAPIGINSCTVNNVNAAPDILADDFIPQLARVAAVFRPWGVQLSISVDLSTPAKLRPRY